MVDIDNAVLLANDVYSLAIAWVVVRQMLTDGVERRATERSQ